MLSLCHIFNEHQQRLILGTFCTASAEVGIIFQAKKENLKRTLRNLTRRDEMLDPQRQCRRVFSKWRRRRRRCRRRDHNILFERDRRDGRARAFQI